MKLFYRVERDKDFFDVCEAVRKESKEYRSVQQIATIAALRPAQSYYLTKKQILSIIQLMRLHPHKLNLNRNKVKLKLYKQIYSVYLQHDVCANQVAHIIDLSPAPRFYMSSQTATSLYYKLLKCNI